MKKRILVAGILLIGLGGLASVQLFHRPSSQPPQTLQTSFQYETPRPLQPFELQDQNGHLFDNDKLKQKWSLIFAGYTSCPDVCPTTLGKLSAVYPKLAQVAPIQVILLSVDPERDSQSKLKDYLAFFHPEFIGLRAEHPALLPFSRDLGLVYSLVGDGPDYQVDHSASLILISPDGRRYATIKPSSQTPGQLPQIRNDELLADFRTLVTQYQGPH
ncbi:SCO family protein [Shewanella algae]|uniref:SCO family protein n=1 Tax=Shewanella algae TaxID=38313 RepID=UPI00313CCDB6